MAQIKSIDSESAVYVATYGYEITISKGEKSTYADTLWIDTILPVSKIEEIIEKCGIDAFIVSFVFSHDIGTT